jgi:predicted transcriptional regulator
MKSSVIFKKTLECQKAAFNAGFNTIVILQAQAEKMTNTLLDKMGDPAKKNFTALTDTLETYKQSREEFKKIVDESFTKAEAFFG